MTMTEPAADPRFPVGKFQRDVEATPERRREWIESIAETPARFRAAVEGLSDEQMDTPYRDGGWTVRQVVHHVADSHMNAYLRTKFALSEDNPTIKPYPEQIWAEMTDGRTAAVTTSLDLIEALHTRWVMLLQSLTPAHFARTLLHPERGPMSLDDVLDLYSWHCRHHTAHVTARREREGW